MPSCARQYPATSHDASMSSASRHFRYLQQGSRSPPCITPCTASNNASPKTSPQSRPRCRPRSNCSTTAPPSPSSPAIARRPPAASTTPNCACSRNACATCASWRTGARPSWPAWTNRASSPTPCACRSRKPTPRRAWRTCTSPTSPSAAPRRRSRARRDWSRWHRHCSRIPRWPRNRVPSLSSMPTRAWPTPRPRWTVRAPS